MSRLRTTVGMTVREYLRTPVLLALLVGLPTYVVLLFGRVVPDRETTLVVSGEPVRAGVDAATATLMAPMVAALVGGVAGLFLVDAGAGADGRLVLVGARVRDVLLARLSVVGLAAGLAGLVAVGAAALTRVPDAPVAVLAATVTVGLSYGAVGALVGLALSRLAGVYVMLFGPTMDVFLAQSPFAGDVWVAPYLPAHGPTTAAFRAAFGGTVDLAALGTGLGYAVALVTLVYAAFLVVRRGKGGG